MRHLMTLLLAIAALTLPSGSPTLSASSSLAITRTNRQVADDNPVMHPRLIRGETITGIASWSSAAETPGPSLVLYQHPWYRCTHNYYVAVNGDDRNNGTSPATPWATIQHADTSSRLGGDCINVAPGIYRQNVLIQHGGSAPTATGYVVYRCSSGPPVIGGSGNCHVLAPGGGHLWGFRYAGNFVVVDGFELDGNNSLKPDGIADACIASDDETFGLGANSYQAGASSHHIWVIDNIIHHCNLAGVDFNGKEWVYTIHNTVYHNSWQSGYQGSGIGYVVQQCIEAGAANCYTSGIAGTPPSDYSYVPFGSDKAAFDPAAGVYTPFHDVVAWNVVYNNRVNYDNPVPCGAHTDGNGIIMDTFLDRVSLKLRYPYQTLVMNNISFYNGGRGIHVFAASNVTVANNTVFNNNTDACLSSAAYVLGDLSQAGGTNNVWVNNISLSVPNFVGNTCALMAGNGRGIVDLNNTFMSNVLSTAEPTGGHPPCIFDNDKIYFSCSSNRCGTNPALVNAFGGVAAGRNNQPLGGRWIPGNSNFAITSNSPAYRYAVNRRNCILLLFRCLTESDLPATSTNAGACHDTVPVCPFTDVPPDY
jgi:parallel beta-helix repeat protein